MDLQANREMNNVFLQYEEADVEEKEETLDQLFPKLRQGTKILRVSRTQATRFDILDLQDRLDSQLEEHGARDVGICFVRKWLFDQFFDELIRQEVLAEPGRGAMLKEVKEELATTMKALWHVCLSTFAFATAKCLLTRRNIIAMRIDMHRFQVRMEEIATSEKAMLKAFEGQLRDKALENEIRLVKQNFAEEQLEKDKDIMESKLLDRNDPDHNWLFDDDDDSISQE